MVLTPRDTEMLRLVARYRFLRSTHFHPLLGGSRTQLLRRLQKLFHHRYVERPVCQIDYYRQGGSRPMVYGLSARGAAYLRRTDQLPSHRFVGVAGNGSIHRLFLEHALMVSDLLVALEKVCRARADVQLLRADELPETLSHWQVEAPPHGNIGVVPDAVFQLRFADGTRKDILCCLEADRGTMPVLSHDPQRSSLARKFAAYSASWRAGIFRSLGNRPRVRVLTVTSSTERLNSIHEHLRGSAHSPDIFMQTALAAALANPGALLDSLLTAAPRDS